MPTPILMPALSPTMTEGNLAKWLVKEGDAVKAGMVIAEIETDKATMEVEAVDEGQVAKILIASGAQAVAVNTPIAVLLDEGEKELPAGWSIAAPKTAAAPQAASAPPPQAKTNGHAVPATTGTRIFASPLAKRMAGLAGIDLHSIKGTGPGGRIVKADVENAQRSPQAPSAPTAPKTSPPAPQGMDARSYADALGMEYDFLPNTGVRKVIARRLLESKLTVPHFYLTVECRIDALLELRKKVNSLNEKARISVNDFVIRATALALKAVPAANASWTDEGILQFKRADISVAVATPGGLITPIIKAAEGKSVSVISAEMKDLAARARDGKLKPDEFQGGGFSISNLGMFGIKEFAAIINPPQACILAVGAGEQRPVVEDGNITIGTLMNCTLSVDHRAVDGAVGAEFLAAFKKLIEEPLALMS